jgi:hypothetical protein
MMVRDVTAALDVDLSIAVNGDRDEIAISGASVSRR